MNTSSGCREALGAQQSPNWPGTGNMLHAQHSWKSCVGRNRLIYDTLSCERTNSKAVESNCLQRNVKLFEIGETDSQAKLKQQLKGHINFKRQAKVWMLRFLDKRQNSRVFRTGLLKTKQKVGLYKYKHIPRQKKTILSSDLAWKGSIKASNVFT
jgi:hypothetical protein